jgi:cobyrinic acid a,c-diamide synthase
MNLPCITISAPQGRSGKTIVSLGLCAALKKRGLAVQPFKKGPDYIDPSWLTAAADRSCRSLDTILMPEDALLASFSRGCQGADLALIEGAMGLYDGFDSQGRASTARIARLLGSPVVLVVNTLRMTRSVAALVSGFQSFEPQTNIAGVILNNVSGSRHQGKLADAIENYCKIPVVGSIPKDATLNIAERHLGLTPFAEAEEAKPILERVRQRLEPCLDIEGLLAIASKSVGECKSDIDYRKEKSPVVRVGVMHDRVFNFYYPENLEALQEAGAELVFINSLKDNILPDIDALYIGGGFPEFFLRELEANRTLRLAIAHEIENYLPVYAECAGLMYLCRSILWHKECYEMVGIVPAEIELCPRPQGHGYVEAEVIEDNPIFPRGLKLWGHEFHHSHLIKADSLKFAYRLQRGQGVDGQRDGIIYKNVFAAYTHIHALGVPGWSNALVSLARKHHLLLARKNR